MGELTTTLCCFAADVGMQLAAELLSSEAEVCRVLSLLNAHNHYAFIFFPSFSTKLMA